MNNFSARLPFGAFLFAESSSAYSFGTSDFTAEMWLRSSHPGTLISRKGPSNSPKDDGGFLLAVNADGSVTFNTDNGSGYYEVMTKPVPVIDGLWHHVAAVRHQGELLIYVDGKLVPSTVRSSLPTPLNVSNGRRITIGSTDQSQEEHRYFQGLIAEVRVWRGARSQAEIAGAMHDRLTGAAPGLVGYWPFEFARPLDYSATRNNAVQNGAVSFSTDVAPVREPAREPMTFQFSGSYEAYAKPDGTGEWQQVGLLDLSSLAIIVYDEKIINAPKFHGNKISWDRVKGNGSSAEITFQLAGENPIFWPAGVADRKVFEGWLEVAGAARQEFKGAIANQLAPCAFMQNCASGLVLDAGEAAPGSRPNLQGLRSGGSQHFCVGKDGTIRHMMSGLALTVQDGRAIEGRPVVIEPVDGSSDAQVWIPGENGILRSALNKDLAISLTRNTGTVLAAANPSDRRQRWHALRGRQIVYSAVRDLVLAVGSASEHEIPAVGQARKLTENMNQLWYFADGYILSALKGLVLTIAGDGSERNGAEVVLRPMNPFAAGQSWSFRGTQILTPTGAYAVSLSQSTDGTRLVLAEPAGRPEQRWLLAEQDDNETGGSAQTLTQPGGGIAPTASERRPAGFSVKVYTANEWFAGTDEWVRIALVGKLGTTSSITLIESRNHERPFQMGNMDTFEVDLPYVGELTAIHISYGKLAFFWVDDWEVDSIFVYDYTDRVFYGTGKVGRGSLPTECSIPLDLISRGTALFPAEVCQYPATFGGRIWPGWMDHTYLRIEEHARTTYFDAAGGRTPPDGYKMHPSLGVSMSLDTAVKMATGRQLGPDYPWKEDYGENDVTGKETCGIVASGFRNRDGSCHQIINRLLHISHPPASLDLADPPPEGCGISYFLFGPYGIDFASWCTKHGFDATGTDANSGKWSYIGHYVGDKSPLVNTIYYYVTAFQARWNDDPSGLPDGKVIREFVRKLNAEVKLDVARIATLLSLSEEAVRDLLKDLAGMPKVLAS